MRQILIKCLNFILLFLLTLKFLLLSVLIVYAEEQDSSFEQSGVFFENLKSSLEENYKINEINLENNWAQLEKEEEQKWLNLKTEVLKIWDKFHPTTKKIWVDYAPQKESYSLVDFEKGEIILETLVPDGDQTNEAERNLNKQLKTVIEKQDSTGTPFLKNLLPQDIKETIKEKKFDVLPIAKVTGKDGIIRQKYQIKISMVPDHLQKRVERYFLPISVAAEKQNVDPALVLAVIHSESSFNPFARSSVPAFGLMQIVPRHAGKDAYMELFGEEKVLTADYLYDANNNILLGVTYLKMLNFKYFKDISDTEKRRIIIICAYNWGPTAVRNRFMNKINIFDLSYEDLFARLLKSVPKETHDYLIRVEDRRKMYKKTINIADAE